MTARVHSRGRRRAKPQEGFLSNLLDPIDRLAETIYSVLILLTFTLAFRIFKLNPGEIVSAEYVNELLIAAFAATLAWGVIDGIVYVLTEVLERGERHRILWYIQSADTEQEAAEAVADELDFILEPITGEAQRALLYRDVLEHLHDSQPQPVRLKREDFIGALACILVAIIAVLPSLVPFAIFRDDYALAIRVSNVISFAVLFYAGYEWGKYTGTNPWKIGLVLVLIGVLLVTIAIPFGG
jgi:VIT1/CCC1 family predicted Fe2+/Mn2+ transporter